MKHLTRVVVVLFLAVFFQVGAVFAVTFIDCDFDSAPSSEGQGGVYNCDAGSLTLWMRNTSGSTNGGHEWAANEGWNGGGAAKFYLHRNLTDSDRQLVQSSFSSPSQQNRRFLLKAQPGIGSSTLDGKWLDTGATNPWRTWLSFADRSCGAGEVSPEMAYNGTGYVLHSGGRTSNPCGSYQWCPSRSWGEGWWDPVLQSCDESGPRLDMVAYAGQWVAFEIEKINDGSYNIYVWTEDGAFNGLYYAIDTNKSGPIVTDAFGVYSEGSRNGEWFLIDEAVTSDRFIGPPAGFGSGVVPPTPDPEPEPTGYQARVNFTVAYDDQGIPGYELEVINVYLNGEWLCDSETANVSCVLPEGTTAGGHQISVQVEMANGNENPVSQIAMGTLPPAPEPEPEPDPDPLPAEVRDLEFIWEEVG